MARLYPDPNILMQKLGFLQGPITFLIVLTTVIFVFSAVTFLCGSHGGAVNSPRRKESKKAVRLGGKKKTVIEKMKSKALLTAKIVSCRKVQDEGEAGDLSSGKEEEEEEERDHVVWKKAIMKGEKCKPIDFSGKILYDTDGNLLTD